MEIIIKITSFLSDAFTIIASGIAIYIFFAKRKSITNVIKFLMTITYQTSLSEIKEKLERLNEYNANEPKNHEHIRNILSEIAGQIKGNDRLTEHFKSAIMQIEDYEINKRKLTEPKKRTLVFEIREKLKHLNVKTIDEILGENK